MSVSPSYAQARGGKPDLSRVKATGRADGHTGLSTGDCIVAEIKVDEMLWACGMAPEGLVERWFVPDGAPVAAGQAVVEVRVEDALHELLAPAAGRLKILAPADDLIEPGSILGRIDA